ncbi:MAG: aldose 1-epimerase family protein [Prevotella sp.]|nr:aldose 1-epimerase family protein [Prevotella sp.]
METIKNEHLTVCVSEMGAELQSIKDSEGREYLWQGGEKWPRRSPILFPIVCSVNDDTYTVDGQEYHLPRHGFARDTKFKLIAQGEHKVTYALHESEETLKVYPYRFNLAVSYRLSGNKIHVVWHVENTDCREIHFQIGGHPAFLAPGCKEDEDLKGVIQLLPSNLKSQNSARASLACYQRDARKLKSLKSYIDGSHEMTEIELDQVKDGLIPFNDEFFANDSVKIHDCQTHEACLLDTDGSPAVTVDYKCPIIAFWSPYQKKAPFVCIEPWYGLGDPRGWKGEFKDKPYMNHLQPGASFMSEYTITIK